MKNMPVHLLPLAFRMSQLGVPLYSFQPKLLRKIIKNQDVIIVVDCAPGCGHWVHIAPPSALLVDLLKEKPEKP